MAPIVCTVVSTDHSKPLRQVMQVHDDGALLCRCSAGQTWETQWLELVGSYLTATASF